MYVIGLTGNVATGKSTVAAMLGSLGAHVIDADKLAHWVMRAGSEANHKVIGRFGPEVLTPEGEIDRAKLADIVFSDRDALSDLERIVHPPVVEETIRQLEECDSRVSVVEAIKLIEAGIDKHCDAVWVVISHRDQQIERLVRARHLTVVDARVRIDAQPPAEQNLGRADVVIDNSGRLEETWAQVLRAWNAIPSVSPVPGDTLWTEPGQGEFGAVNWLKGFLDRRPRLASWIILAIGMVALLLWAAPDDVLTAGQLMSLVVACIALAGACAWIIGWE